MILPSKHDKEINLYPQLEDGDSTVLLLSGGAKAALVHKYTQGADVLDTWQVCFLIEDLSILDQAEKDKWFGGANPEKYIVLGGENTGQQPGAGGPNKKKLEADQGATSSFMLSNGKVNKTAVGDAFAKGDLL